ncbi:DNA repair protein RAD51 homolog 3-like [Saccoglossus kowalevskii]|uniref:DNA repair protein RAD51 homolog 3 n=1 Tax=Saccoglossus kowalevskii TaxID=10224 RepID=A0ABM0GLS7_SACKO|nr:PREDICTED: DNA repair protein RAD51 homolog 3-like [Saccoglossus kowalevskii]
MQRNLATFHLPPEHRRKLQEAGFQTVSDIIEVSPIELSKELEISKEDALEILQLVKGTNITSSTALEKLKEEKELPFIITFCEELDTILGGGVPLAKITEFCGAPGIGKTQIGIQLAVDVQIPSVFGGVEGEAIYIDTEGSFMVHRAVDIAQATVSHCISSIENNPKLKEVLNDFTVNSILSKIYVYRCNDYIELIATVNLLPQFLTEHPRVKLIVLDSIAFHFRNNFDDMALRTRLLNGLAQNLIRMASQHKLAVVLTNQMTTKIKSDDRGQSHVVPALGESWGHASTLRIVLFWQHNQRYARLYKSPSRKEATVPYTITMGGIRSIGQQNIDKEHKDGDHGDDECNPRKRMRLDE